MSLGVVAIENNDVYVMADTLLSYTEKSGKKPFHGLKVFFLNEDTAIAYSGTAGEVAHGRLYEIYTQGCKSDIEILAKKISIRFDHEVEFLLAKSGENPAIAKISNGSFSIRRDNGGVYWIGDIDAARHVLSVEQITVEHLCVKFNEVIGSQNFITVGGHCVMARGKLSGFNFVPYMNLISPRYIPKNEEWEPVNFGTAQTGGFGFTTVVPSKEGTNGWGVFYFQGMFGEFWHVNLEKNICEVLTARAENVHSFIEVIQNEIGEELTYCGSYS